MFEGTEKDWQNLPKSKQIKMVVDMLDRLNLPSLSVRGIPI